MNTNSDSPGENISSAPAINFAAACRFWLKLGFISFGGPAGQIAIMHQELVEKRQWISERRFLHALNYCMILPGPEAQQLATYLGWLMHGIKGGVIAGVLFILPSMLLLIGLAWLYLSFGNLPEVQAVLYGIKPAVTAIVLFAAWRIGLRVLTKPLLWLLAGMAFVGLLSGIGFPYLLIGAALIGVLVNLLRPGYFSAASHHSSAKNFGVAIIDDETPIPEYARFNVSRSIILIIAGLFFSLGLWLILSRMFGGEHVFVALAKFFTKAALLTFGGAYAGLPYVYQAAVVQFQWLTATQMIDGLALGETTPGPLIIIVTFVGFLAGWQQQALGSESLLLAGISGGLIATWFTFLPSFLFILLGAPLVEASRDDVKFTAPLTAITAAVVGAIVNLAIFLAIHIVWPQGFSGSVDIFALIIMLAAFIALVRYKAGIVSTMLACCVAGLLKFWM